MNALIIPQPSSGKLETSQPPKKALLDWLSSDAPAEQMAASLIRSGKVASLEEALPSLREAATEECGEAGIKAILTAAFVHFPQPERVPSEWNVFWQGYIATCGHMSKAAVQAGMMRWLADGDSQYLPLPGKLRELATQTPTEEHRVLNKARQVLDAVREAEERDRIAQDHARRGTDKDRQRLAVREMMASLGPELKAAAAKQTAGLRRQAIAHANRCVRPEGELTPAQIDVLRKCGVE